MSDPGTIGGLTSVAACVLIAAGLIWSHLDLRK